MLESNNAMTLMLGVYLKTQFQTLRFVGIMLLPIACESTA